MATRADSDQEYVTQLVDEALGERGLREHRFDWLLGDPGLGGRRRRLPVDAFYPRSRVVLEYRERQHERSAPIMDRRMTISGVDRGQQRRLYDRRRDELIPTQGLRLVVIRADDLDVGPRGRLRRRDRDADLAAVRRILDS